MPFFRFQQKKQAENPGRRKQMAGALNVRHGAKMRIAFDVPVGQDPQFNMVCMIIIPAIA